MSIWDETREQQKKMKGKPLKEKWSYFWEYYKVHTLVIALVIACGSWFIYDVASAKDEAFSAILLNAYGQNEQANFSADFASYAGIDTNTYACNIDTIGTLDYSAPGEAGYAYSQRIYALTQAHSLDVFISDTEPFDNYAVSEFFLDLREELTEKEYEIFEPYFFYVDGAAIEARNNGAEPVYDENGLLQVSDPSIDHSDPTSMKDPIPVGIYLEDNAKLAQWDCYTFMEETPIFGFVCTSERKELAHQFLQYLTEE
jgi:hypothetical protein